MSNMNLSSREVKELTEKLSKKISYNFSLDLSKAKPPEYFESKMLAAVPKIDKPTLDSEP